MTDAGDQRLLTVQDAAAVLQVHEETVRRWIRAGELAVVDLGKKAGYRIKQSDLDIYVNARYGRIGGEGEPKKAAP